MVRFSPQQPITTKDPLVQVDQLPAGRWMFELVVRDTLGRDSDPFQTLVFVTASSGVVGSTPPGGTP